MEHKDEFIDHISVDDVIERNPAEKSIKRFKTSPYKRLLGLMRILKHKFAKIKNSSEILVHLFLELLDLVLRELTFGMVKDFLTEHLEYAKIVFADIHIIDRGGTDIVDERLPG